MSYCWLFSLFFHSAPSLAEEGNQNAAKSFREELQKKLDIKEGEIEVLEVFIQQKETESASFERDIAIVNAKIKKAKLQILRLDAEIAKTKNRHCSKN